jgi:hypothetical protein
MIKFFFSGIRTCFAKCPGLCNLPGIISEIGMCFIRRNQILVSKGSFLKNTGVLKCFIPLSTLSIHISCIREEID